MRCPGKRRRINAVAEDIFIDPGNGYVTLSQIYRFECGHVNGTHEMFIPNQQPGGVVDDYFKRCDHKRVRRHMGKRRICFACTSEALGQTMSAMAPASMRNLDDIRFDRDAIDAFSCGQMPKRLLDALPIFLTQTILDSVMLIAERGEIVVHVMNPLDQGANA